MNFIGQIPGLIAVHARNIGRQGFYNVVKRVVVVVEHNDFVVRILFFNNATRSLLYCRW